MDDDRRKKLVNLGAEALADALLELAKQNDRAEAIIVRMLASPKENIRRIKARIAAVKRSRRFVTRRESFALAQKLETLLEDIRASVTEPETGLRLVAAFYDADEGALGNSDDSDGDIGDVYRITARDLFVEYAKRHPDPTWPAELAFELNQVDDYGVRDSLIHAAAEYLPKPDLRAMTDRLQAAVDDASDESERCRRLLLLESLAQQAGDAKLYEKTALDDSESPPEESVILDIASVHLASGDAQTALAWIEKTPPEHSHLEPSRNRLLLDIYEGLGDTAKQTEVAWRLFRQHRCAKTLEKLLSLIGEERRDEILLREITSILSEPRLFVTDVRFLMELGRIDEAETYLLRRADALNGNMYESLLPLAKEMETAGRPLAASMIYRALLNSILQNARTTAYPSGARHLRKMDELANSISDWNGFCDHATYVAELRRFHYRKTSFWSRYGG